MKKLNLIFFFLLTSLFANEELLIPVDNSFITKVEYGKMLYNNPRGIGCNTCHGENGKGKKIVGFKHTYDKKTYDCNLTVPSILDVKQKAFSKKINTKKNPKKKFEKHQVCEKLTYYANVMPTYFLVQDEIDAIYQYVQSLKQK